MTKLDPEKQSVRAAARTDVAVVPLVSRPAVNVAQETSRDEPGSLVWEAVSFNGHGRPWQWRAWFEGTCVGVVSWSRARGEYCAAAMHKRLGAYAGQKTAWVDASVPPCIDAINAVSYTVVDLMTSGAAVEADQEAVLELGEGPEADAARRASAELLLAHEARYEVDELDDRAVDRANRAVQAAMDACDIAYSAVVNAAKTAEQRTQEAKELIDASADLFAEFNRKHTTAGRGS